MDFNGPDLLLALTFTLLGTGLGLVGGVALAFWIAGLGPGEKHRLPAAKS